MWKLFTNLRYGPSLVLLHVGCHPCLLESNLDTVYLRMIFVHRECIADSQELSKCAEPALSTCYQKNTVFSTSAEAKHNKANQLLNIFLYLDLQPASIIGVFQQK